MSSRETSDIGGPPGFHRDLLRFSPGATILVDREGTIVAANTIAGRLLLSDPEGLKGKAIKNLIPERVQETWSQVFSRCFGDPEDWPLGEAFDLCLRQADSSEFAVTISLQPWPQETPTLVVAWVQDTSQHYEIEKALRDSEKRFRIAAEHTADAIQEINFETDELKLSDEVDKLMGYSPGGFPRTLSGWLDHIHPEDQDRVRAEFQQFTESGAEKWKFSYRMRAADGSYHYWLDHGTVTESSEDGQILRGVGAAQDITESVLRERELQKALAEPRRSVCPVRTSIFRRSSAGTSTTRTS